MAFKLSELPYAENALAPNISEETIELHYGKHHKSHVDNLNNLIISSEFEGKSLDEIIRLSSGSILNHAAEVKHEALRSIC